MNKRLMSLFLLPGLISVSDALPAQENTAVNKFVPYETPLAPYKKSKIYIMRGEKIRFFSKISASMGTIHVAVKAGGNPIVQGNFENKWELVWDSARETHAGRLLWLYAAKANGQEVAIATVDVNILDKPPFEVSSQPDSTVKGRYAIVVKPLSDLKADSYNFFCDDTPLHSVTVVEDKLFLDAGTLTPGPHRITVSAHTEDGGNVTAGAFDITCAARVRCTLNAPGGLCDLRTGQTVFKVMAEPDADLVAGSVEYFFDNASLGKSSGKAKEMSFDLTKTRSGKHRLYVIVTTPDGVTARSENYQIEVKRDLKGDYLLWREQFLKYYNAQVESLNLIQSKLNEQYIGKKQCTNARDTLLAEMKRYESADTEIMQLVLPAELEAEDRRNLTAAQEQLEQSFRDANTAMKNFTNALALLLPYDGQVGNAPANVRSDYIRLLDIAKFTNLSSAGGKAASALSNIQLVEQRGNFR